MADNRQRAESKILQVVSTMCVRVLYPLFTAASFLVVVIAYATCFFVLLLPRSQYVPHPTPHVPLLASWRSLRWSSNCDALVEIIHVIRCRRCVLSGGIVATGVQNFRS